MSMCVHCTVYNTRHLFNYGSDVCQMGYIFNIHLVCMSVSFSHPPVWRPYPCATKPGSGISTAMCQVKNNSMLYKLPVEWRKYDNLLCSPHQDMHTHSAYQNKTDSEWEREKPHKTIYLVSNQPFIHIHTECTQYTRTHTEIEWMILCVATAITAAHVSATCFSIRSFKFNYIFYSIHSPPLLLLLLPLEHSDSFVKRKWSIAIEIGSAELSHNSEHWTEWVDMIWQTANIIKRMYSY